MTQRAHIIAEIIGSERDHIADMGMAESIFLLPLKAKLRAPDQALLHSVSTNLAMIRHFNQVLLEELQNQAVLVAEKQLIGKVSGTERSHVTNLLSQVFVRLSDFSKMLVQYCGSQPTFLEVVARERKTDKVLDAFLDEAKRQCRGLDLGQLLLKPLQRTCKYPLLLQELLKATPQGHVDAGNLEEAIAKTQAVVGSLNDGQKLLESFAKIAQLAADIKMDVPEFDLFQKGRTFIREGPFEELCDNGKRRALTMIMFDDVLLIGKYKKKQFKYRAHYPLAQTECGALAGKCTVQESELGFTLLFKGDAPLSALWPSRDVRYLWFQELSELSKGKSRGGKVAVSRSSGTVSNASVAAQRKVAASEERMQRWRASLDDKAEAQLEELRQEAAARKRYEESLAAPRRKEGKDRKESAKPRFPSLVQAVPEAIADVSLLLQMASRYTKSTRPELVVLGEAGSGRSSLIDALLGVRLLAGVPTTRFVRVELKNSAKSAASWTVGGERVATAAEACELLRRELGRKGDETVTVEHESPNCFSALLLDTPALGVSAKQDARVKAECGAASRTLLWVESAKRWEGASTFPFAVRSNLDPSLERSLFVYTKFAQQLQLFLQPSDLTAFLRQCPLPSLSHFVTLPNPLRDSTLADEEAGQQDALAQFRYDDGWQRFFALPALLQKVNSLVFDYFADEVFPAALVRFEADSRRSVAAYEARTHAAETNLNEEVRRALGRQLGRVAERYARLMEGSWGEVARTGLGATQTEEAARSGARWQAQKLGAGEERPAVLFADCKLAAGAKLQRLLSEFRQVVAQACADAQGDAPEEQLQSDRLAEKVVVPSFASLGIARERRLAALERVIGPACHTLATRAIALVQETMQGANGLAMSALPVDELETDILHCCKLSLTGHAAAQLAERYLLAFRAACSECVAVHLESDDLPLRVDELLHTLVVVPLTDANALLNALHTALAHEGVDNVFNRAAFHQQLSSRVKDAKREADLMREAFATFGEKAAKIRT